MDDQTFKFGFSERLAFAGFVVGVAGGAASWVVPPSLSEWLLGQGIQPDYIFIGCVLLVACTTIFFLIDFSVYVFAKFGVRRAVALVIVGTAFIILGGLVGMYGAFTIDHPRKSQVTSGPRPILKLAFLQRDVLIRWPDADLFPHTEDQQQKPPLTVKIRNIGALKAVDVVVSFAIADDEEKLRDDLQASVFKQLDQRQGESWEIPLEFLSGKPSRWINVSLHGENIRRLQALAEEDSIAYPPVIQTRYWLRAIQQAHVASGLVDAKNREIVNSGKSPEEIMIYFSKRRLPTIIVLPEVSFDISYKDQNGKAYRQREKVKTIYIPVGAPFWGIENGKLLFHGGFGILGFDDTDNPDDGFFALAKRQGLVE